MSTADTPTPAAVPSTAQGRFRPPRPTGLLLGLLAVLLLAIPIVFFAIVRASGAENGTYSAADRPLRVFASTTPHSDILRYAEKELSRGQFTLSIIEETDGVDGNDVVESGDADANYFQHVPYLKTYSADKGYHDLRVAATVHVEPYGIYSRRYKNLQEIPDGGLVLLSNNVTNFARGLYLLQDAGLITLDRRQNDASPEALSITRKNIVGNPKHLTFREVDPAQIPRSLPDAAIGLVNGNVALEAGFSPSKDALKLESATNNPFANILVVPEELTSDPRVKALAKVLESREVADYIEHKYPGSVIPVVRNQR